MRLHYLQHVPFEDLAKIKLWAEAKNHDISRTQLFNNKQLPKISDFDWLIVMGGPMNIYDEEKYPWLAKEKQFIKEAIASQKIVLGVCLGAQLIADALGGTVYKNNYKEIGWFPVSLTQEAKKSSIFNTLPDKFIAFHWHGDAFDLPPGATIIAENEGCANQAFEYNGRVIGLQFHLESSIEGIKLLIRNCGDEITEGKYIQTPDEILSLHDNLQEINGTMDLLLDNIEREFGGGFS